MTRPRPPATRPLTVSISLFLLFAGGSCVRPEGSTETASVEAGVESPAERGLFERIAVLGASASNGFGLQSEVGAPTSFADVISSVLLADHAIVEDASNPMFFIDPAKSGSAAVDRVLEARPTLVVALDFLFWYGYGFVPDDQRLARLEEGFTQLERFDAHLLIGDFPDVSRAVGTMLAEAQVPEPETLAALNARVAQWCDERPDATLFPMSEYVRILDLPGDHRIGRLEVLGASEAGLRQDDELHPTLRGTAVLTILALQSLAWDQGLDLDRLRWDHGVVAGDVYASKEPERERAAERERQREERRRARSGER